MNCIIVVVCAYFYFQTGEPLRFVTYTAVLSDQIFGAAAGTDEIGGKVTPVEGLVNQMKLLDNSPVQGERSSFFHRNRNVICGSVVLGAISTISCIVISPRFYHFRS